MSEEKELHDRIKYLIGQLQNCVNHLEHAKRHTASGNNAYDGAIDSANKAIYSVTKNNRHHGEISSRI
jgi:hypothetical protein